MTCDTVGLMARTVADLELLVETFKLVDDRPPTTDALDLSHCSFGFVKTHVWSKASPAVIEIWEQAKRMLEETGAKVEEVDLPEGFDNIGVWHRNILHMEGQSSFLSDYLKAPDQLDPWVKKHVENDTATTRQELLDSYDNIARLRPVLDSIAAMYTALVTPSVTDEAPLIEEPLRFTGDASFNLMWTVLHTPVLNVPGFVGPSGLPIGLSLISGRYRDQHLLRCGQAVADVFVTQ